VLKRNEEVLIEVKVEPILHYICRYHDNWREHVNSMSRTRISKATTKGQEIIRTPNEEMA
jgi:hypothetical protein